MDQATEILRTLGRVEGRLDGILEEQRRLADYTETISSRVSAVEKDQSNTKGWIAGVSAVVSALVSVIAGLIKSMFS